jgi:acyl-CoA synthetase (AMP-forming)/AMP-acid ligase II
VTISGWGLAEVVRTHGHDRPVSAAITYGGQIVSWGRLDERSSRLAGALVSHGVGQGDRIAFLGKNAPEYFEVLFGGAKLGAVTVAINWRLKPAEICYIATDAGARVVFVDAELAPTIPDLQGSLPAASFVVFGSDPATELPGALRYEDWLSGHDAVDPGHPGGPGDVAFQLYTSGTTGLPKGAMLTNANIRLLNEAGGSMFGIDADSVNLVGLPTFHIGGAGYAVVGMAQGCHTILLRDFDPAAALEALRGHRVTNAFFVPAMLAAMSAVPGAADGDYSSLRSIIYGASPITDETLRTSIRTFGCDFFQVYGMTETSGAITQLAAEDHDPDGERSHLLRSAGKPFGWVEIRIVDQDTGKDRPTGEVGELWTRSGQNMVGYWNAADATAQTITQDGWLRTGDAGYLDDDGYIFLTDRVKDMVVSGGENVYPVEVENVLSAHPAIADVAVIGVPDAKWGETVKAVVVLKPGAVADSAAIISFARERIAHFKCPTSVDFIDVLPRNPSGKILKRELREPYWSGHDRRVG